MKAMPDKSPFTKFLRTYQESDIIFEGNSLGSEMYVIHSGKVRLTTKKMGRDVILATLGPGEFFGEMAIDLFKECGADGWVTRTEKTLAELS